jgi:plastocyanin
VAAYPSTGEPGTTIDALACRLRRAIGRLVRRAPRSASLAGAWLVGRLDALGTSALRRTRPAQEASEAVRPFASRDQRRGRGPTLAGLDAAGDRWWALATELRPRRAASLAGAWLVGRLDALGTPAARRLEAHRARRAQLAHPPRFGLAVGAALGAVVVLLAWAALEGTGGGDDWFTAPGAGNAEVVAQLSSVAARPRTAPAAVEKVTLKVNPPPLGGVRGPDGQVHDAFVPASFTMHVGRTYEVTVVNYDTMPHTFTSPGLGLNEVIAPGSAAAPKVTTFVIKPTRTGTYGWYCATPCDAWAMVHDGFMRGELTVV